MLLHDFDNWATLQPEAIAVRADGRVIRYRELRSMAHRVALGLAARGVGVDDRVAIYMPTSIVAIANVFGILYAGAAYVPIDPRTPEPRVAQILSGCRARAVIAYGPYLEKLTIFDEQLLDGNLLLTANTSATNWVGCPRARADSAAYVLFTSGSTGQPKGVVISHAAACSFVDWARRSFALSPKDHLTSLAPLSFDLSVFDIFGALSSGALVDLVGPELLLRPKELVGRLAEWETSTVYTVPSTITLLEREGELARTALPNLHHVLYAGEPFAIPALIAAMQALPQARFFNLFGPTETNVCTYHPIVERPLVSDTEVSIGMACDHLVVELLDDASRPVAQGDEGELCVAGTAVMTEYFDNPSATIAAFHPASSFADGQRRYRTGDRAIADASGRFWFRGRRDRLVKRRGYRVELGDIEAALRRHPQVREAAAVAASQGSETRIVAYVSLKVHRSSTSLIMRAHCGSLLPSYMVPDSVQILDELPRTLTGKLDLQLLRPEEQAS